MATYRNKNDDTIFYGGEFKLNISMDAIDDYHIEDVDFLCTFKVGGKAVTAGRLKEYINDYTTILQEDILRVLINLKHRTMPQYLDLTGLQTVWNRIKTYISGLGFYTKPPGGIPASDIASGVIPTVPTSLSSFTDDLGSSPTHTHSQYLTSHQDISGKENTSNKVTSLSSSSTDTEYPSAKCVWDLVGDIETILASI